MAKYKVFAAIDLGSTHISMKIVQISKKDGIFPIDMINYDISLGKEVYSVGKFSFELTERICNCFEQFLQIMQSYGVDDYVCYATTAMREAANSEYVIDQINIRTGIKVNIISNEEERFLHTKAVALNTEYFDNIIAEGAVIIDIGSGSVQISYYEKSQLKFSQSLPVGALRVLEILKTVNTNSIRFEEIMEHYLNSIMNQYKKTFFLNVNAKHFLAISGQVTQTKMLCNIDSPVLSKMDFEKMYKTLKTTSPEAICDEMNISYDDASLLLPSIIMYKVFLDSIKEPNIYASNIDMVDGICVEYAEQNGYTHTKHIFTNDIISSSRYYADRYCVDSNHYQAVMNFGEKIITCLSKKFGFYKNDLLLFRVAAIFADTGRYININNYSQYSYDIIKANPIIGLSKREHELISYIVLFHTEGIHPDLVEYQMLSKRRKLLVSKLTAILALAKSLDEEYKQKIQKISVSIKNGEMIVRYQSNEELAIEERQFKICAGFFEEVFGIKPKIIKGK